MLPALNIYLQSVQLQINLILVAANVALLILFSPILFVGLKDFNALPALKRSTAFASLRLK